MTNLKAVMTKAWSIFRAAVRRLSFADALRCAWAWVRGKRFGYQVSYVDSARRVTRTMGFSETYDGVRAARISEEWAMIAVGLRPLGSNEFNLSGFAA